jgi:hypothetical protein
MAFAFSPEQRELLFDALGRNDSGAWHLTEDVELALNAYGGVERALHDSPGSATPVAGFEQMLARVSSLCEELYGLPERARQLSALGTLGADEAADLARLARDCGESLERLAIRLAAIDDSARPHPGTHVEAEGFVHALGQAFRNRLNIKPSSDSQGMFRRFLDALINLVGRRHADLNELAQVLSEERLARIIAADWQNSREKP